MSVMAPGDQIFPADLPPEIATPAEPASGDAAWTEALRGWARRELAAGGSDLFGHALEGLERVLIDCALEQTGGQRQKAAELLGLGRNTLTRKLPKFDREDAEPAAEQPQAAAGGT